MTERIFIQPTQIGRVTPNSQPKTPGAASGTKVNFESVFQEQLSQSEIKFSSHALKRLETRNINLSNNDIKLLNEAVNKAESKGARESLILMDQLALVVSVKNRTVITAVDSDNIKDNVFTNIDSAVIVK